MLKFCLRYISSRKTFIMNGGPLEREWTMEEWDKWVNEQTGQSYYYNWAKEALDKPDSWIVRNIKSWGRWYGTGGVRLW